MPEQLQKILERIVEWWKKFNTKQKALLASISAVLILSLVILALFVSKPEMVTLRTCATMEEAAKVQKLLDDNHISYELESNGTEFKIDQKNLANAKILLGSNGIPSDTADINDVFEGGFSATEADKDKRYSLYRGEDLAKILEKMPAIESASARIDFPDNTGTIIAKGEQAKAAVFLKLNEELDEDQAETIAKFVATEIGNEDTSNITIMDDRARLLFSGTDNETFEGTASSQLKLKVKTENYIKNNIRNILVGASAFDHAEIALDLDMNFDEEIEETEEFYAPDGQTNGMIGQQSTYESEARGGSAAVPGTDANDDDTYVIEDSEIQISTVSQSEIIYQNNRKFTSKKTQPGSISRESSSAAITVSKYVIYNEDVLKASGALDEMTFQEYIMANSDPVKVEVDEDYYELVANATGIPRDKISIVSLEEPIFEYSTNRSRSLSDYLQIILAVLIFALLGFVVFRSTRKEVVEEEEPELSVETLLESTKESQESLEDIGFNEKSETRLLIEKFVEENPEAAASLLRNWLNEEWE